MKPILEKSSNKVWNQKTFNLIFFSFSDDWLKTCQIDEPNFDECSKESIQGLFKQLAVGKKNYSAFISNEL